MTSSEGHRDGPILFHPFPHTRPLSSLAMRVSAVLAPSQSQDRANPSGSTADILCVPRLLEGPHTSVAPTTTSVFNGAGGLFQCEASQ